jgi:broad specificity phosphatase PhoE
MKIILLRHEERDMDIGFNSNLTENGIINACLLSDKLKKENIDYIFTSPFIRVLQTIYPYCQINNININIEYGLYEYIHNPYFLFTKWYNTIDDIKDIDLKKIINTEYESVIKREDLILLEDEINLEKRIIKFFNLLIKNYQGKTILIVTHKAVINKIKDIYIEKTDLNSEFKMGEYITLQQINYPPHNNQLDQHYA